MKVKIKRLIAFFIDLFGLAVIIFYPITFLYLMIHNSFFQNIGVKILSLIGIIIYAICFIKKDSLIGYESIGKKIMGLKICFKDNSKVMDKKILINRNIETAMDFPLYILHVLVNNSTSGDEKYNIKVIEKKASIL